MDKPTKYSYSKLNTFENCGWRYFLTYIQGHYIYTENITTEFGTLVHFIEEQIGKALKEKRVIDYEKLKDDFQNINIPKESKFDLNGGVFGVNILKQKYPVDFFLPNDRGQTYATKAQDYLDYGIYRLENYVKENPNLEVYDLEKFFSLSFGNDILSGFIDRIFYDKVNDKYIIEDIKTKDKPFKDEELVTPLQFVIYGLALQNILGDDISISCAYDLPFCDKKQSAGTPGFLARGNRKIKQILNGINNSEFVPKPTPLCAWCPFSPTNEAQPEEGKDLCPYYSLWTRSNRTFAVNHAWEGMDQHERIMKEVKNKVTDEVDFDF